MALTSHIALAHGLAAMVSSTYLRRQAATLVAMSQATFDLGMAGRLRGMATEFHAKAAELETGIPAPSDQTAGEPVRGGF
jgi:hypothetical protein